MTSASPRGSVDLRSGLLQVPSSSLNKPLPSHLLFSLVSIIICPPLGIMAILEAIKVGKFLNLSDNEGAERSAALAFHYSLMGVMIGTNLACLIGTFVLVYIYQAA